MFKNEKLVILTIVLLAIFLRVGGNLASEKVFFNKPLLLSGDAFTESVDSDSSWYDGAARFFLKGKGVTSLDVSEKGFGSVLDGTSYKINLKKIEGNYYAHKAIAPLYSLFLALCYWIGGINTLSYFVPQVILGALTVLFIYLLAKEVFNKKVAALAGLAVAFYPELIFWTYKIRVETLFIFLLVLGFWLLIKGSFQKSLFLTSAGAVVFGLACLTRVTLIPFIPLLFLWQMFSSWKINRKKALGTAFLTILIIGLVLFPWCLRNFLVFDKFTPFTDETYSFLTRNDPKYYSEAEFYYRSYNSLPSRAIAFVKDQPKQYILASLKRFITFWSPYTAPMKKIAKVYKGLAWLIVFPLAFGGMAVLRKKWKKCGLLVVFIFYYALLHAGSFVDSGLVYRYPILPFLCIFAAYGFWVIYKKFKLKNNEDFTN